MNPDWDKEQFLAYILLYAAFADLELNPVEEEYIEEKVGKEEYAEYCSYLFPGSGSR